MKRREFLKMAAAGSASTALAGCLSSTQFSARRENRPNVLFIFDDQHRIDACSCYGGTNITTPNIDRLAAEGMRFTNALSTSPLCTPYRGMLMTGRYPSHSGLLLNFVEANPNERSIANIFSDAGYHTGFIGKWHLSAGALKETDMVNLDVEQLIQYGKENPEYDFTPPGKKRLGFKHWQTFNFHMDFHNGWYYENKPEKKFYTGYETDSQADQTIVFLENNKDSDQPFFLMVAPHPPHPLWRGTKDVPEKYLEKIGDNIKLPPNASQQFPLDCVGLGGKPTQISLLQARTYYAMCKNFDDNLGRILNYLDKSGLAKDTIVVYTSDHGEQLGSQGRRSKLVPYEESVKIPLIIRWPGKVPASKTNDELYTPMDHMPTLRGLTGLEPAGNCDGINLSPTIVGKAKSRRDAVLMAQYVSDPNFCQSQTGRPEWRAVRTKHHTYVKWLTGKEDLFDNKADPHQMDNLVKDPRRQTLLNQMRRKLKELLAEAHDDFLPGTAYADWYDNERNIIKTGLGPI